MAILAIGHGDVRRLRPAGVVALLPGEQATEASARKPVVSPALVQRTARRIQAVGSRIRLAMLIHLLSGPSTYAHLRKATGLAAGPLYFHLGRLRLAGLIGPAERNLYVLTKEGRIFLTGVLLTEAILPSRG